MITGLEGVKRGIIILYKTSQKVSRNRPMLWYNKQA